MFQHDPKDGRHFPAIALSRVTTVLVPITQEQLDELNALPLDKKFIRGEELAIPKSEGFEIETYYQGATTRIGYFPWGDDYPTHPLVKDED